MRLPPALTAEAAARPGFDLLRASLLAAQAATPTAVASLGLHVRPQRAEALSGLLGQLVRDDEAHRSWLHGSFRARPGQGSGT